MSENKDNHGFSVAVAQKIGVNRAIMLQHLRHLQISFLDKEKSAKEVWVKRSRRALSETYPYFTEKEIRGCLDRLERDEYIRSKVDNALNYDRTKSYQLDKKGWDLMGDPASDKKANREQKPSDKRANGFDKRASHNVTKGPMNIGNCSSIVTSVVQQQEEKIDVAVFDSEVNALVIESMALKAEKEKDTPSSAAPLEKEKEVQTSRPTPGESAPRRWDVFDIDRAANEMKADQAAAENFARIMGLKEVEMFERLASAVDDFVMEQKGRKTIYNKYSDFSTHLFNTARKKAQIARDEKMKPVMRNPYNAPSALPASLKGKIGR